MSADRDKWAEMFEIIDQILALLHQKIEEAYKKGRYDALEDNTKEMMKFAKKEERERIADKIEADMPTITRYKALQYLRDLWQALKKGESE